MATRTNALAFASATLLVVALDACGSSTGLLVPDVGPDASAPDAMDVTDVGLDTSVDVRVDVPPEVGPNRTCTDGQFPLIPRGADVILVVDRSGSMADNLNGQRPGSGQDSKWQLLTNALAATLPMYQATENIGALFFPEEGSQRGNAVCDLAMIPNLDIDPATNTASAILAVFQSTGPGGSTPTYAALGRAYEWYVRNPNPAHSRYLVLSTDGGPNCNASLNGATCTCISGNNCNGGTGCLDDARTVTEIAQIANNAIGNVPTYVIGLEGDVSSAEYAALQAMAVAGGRPNLAPGGPSFYAVAQAGDTNAVFSQIQQAISHCSFVAPARPDSADQLTLTIGGTVVPMDPTDTNGWDWTDTAEGEITLFGPACALAATGAPAVIASVMCGDT